jgi:aspartate/methionine/tyrosine aminotransferase
MVRMAGGIAKFVPLRPMRKDVTSSGDFSFDYDELAAAFSHKTKAIIVNTPNNPLGKVCCDNGLHICQIYFRLYGDVRFTNEESWN